MNEKEAQELKVIHTEPGNLQSQAGTTTAQEKVGTNADQQDEEIVYSGGVPSGENFSVGGARPKQRSSLSHKFEQYDDAPGTSFDLNLNEDSFIYDITNIKDEMTPERTSTANNQNLFYLGSCLSELVEKRPSFLDLESVPSEKECFNTVFTDNNVAGLLNTDFEQECQATSSRVKTIEEDYYTNLAELNQKQNPRRYWPRGVLCHSPEMKDRNENLEYTILDEVMQTDTCEPSFLCAAATSSDEVVDYLLEEKLSLEQGALSPQIHNGIQNELDETEEVLEEFQPVNGIVQEDSTINTETPLPTKGKCTQREFADAIARKASIEELEDLLDRGADASLPVTQGLTPLHYAVWQRYGAVVLLLTDRGCDINARDDIGYTALHVCAAHGYEDMMTLLLSRGAKVNVNQAEPDDLYPIDAVDEPLRLALKHDQLSAARILFQHGADPNARYFYGAEINLLSPLQTEALRLLLDHGAQPDHRDRYGFTALMKACVVQQEAEEQIGELESVSGAEVLQHFANSLKTLQSAQMLIARGADVNASTDALHECRSVLHYAVLSGSSALVDLVLQQGARIPPVESYEYPSPLHLATLKGDVGIMTRLIDEGTPVNITAPGPGSPLHVACSETVPNRLEVLTLLLQRGADPNIVVKSESGRPLKPPLGEYLANAPRHEVEVLRLLLRFGTQVVMQTQQNSPYGILNCLYNVSADKEAYNASADNEVMSLLLSAAQCYDIALIRRMPLLVPQPHREMLAEVSVRPVSLKHAARVLLRKLNRDAEAVPQLDLPRDLHQYLLYDTNV